jgi:hypothetical protein
MAAGRAADMSTRVARLVLQGITMLSALGASAGVAVAVNGPHPDALGFFVPFLVSAALGFVLAGVEGPSGWATGAQLGLSGADAARSRRSGARCALGVVPWTFLTSAASGTVHRARLRTAATIER